MPVYEITRGNIPATEGSILVDQMLAMVSEYKAQGLVSINQFTAQTIAGRIEVWRIEAPPRSVGFESTVVDFWG